MTGVVLSINWYGGSMLITTTLTSFISADGYAEENRTEQNLFVWIRQAEAEVTNNKRLQSRYWYC